MHLFTMLKKNTFVHSSVNAARSKIESIKKRKINRSYSKKIGLICDPGIFQSRINSMKSKIKKGKKLPIYLISPRNDRLGIMGFLNLFLPHLAYSVAKGYIPVIDMATNSNVYTTGDENSWELFYEQPFGIGMGEISGHRIIKCPADHWYNKGPHCVPMMDDDDIALWSMIYHTLVRPNKRTTEYMLEEYNSILSNNAACIGVIYRGTDYTKGHPTGHPIQPSKKMLADKIEIHLNSGRYSMVYLASEEKEIVDYLRNRFPGKVLINQRKYYDEVTEIDYSRCNIDHRGVSDVRFDREEDAYLRGIEYMSSINLVSKCDMIIAGGCGATIAALYMNDLKYNERCVFQLGKYGQDNIPEDED